MSSLQQQVWRTELQSPGCLVRTGGWIKCGTSTKTRILLLETWVVFPKISFENSVCVEIRASLLIVTWVIFDEIIENRRWGRFGPIIIVDEIRVCWEVFRVYMSKCWAKSTKFPNEDIRERHRVVFDWMDSAQGRTQIRGTRGPRYHGENQRHTLRVILTTKVDVTTCGNEFFHHRPVPLCGLHQKRSYPIVLQDWRCIGSW